MTANGTGPGARAVLVSRSALFADTVAQSLGAEGIRVVATVAPSPGAVEELGELAADVALVEANGPVADTASLLRRIQLVASIPIVVIGGPADEAQLLELIEAGCCGCVPRDASLRELVDAVRNVCCGRAACSPYLAALVSARIRELAHELTGDADKPVLTRREIEVLQLAARGLTNKEIAQELGIWLQTVKSHLHGAYEKLDVQTRHSAVTKALRLGLIRESQGG
jgi:DNA-binding NarL/FixJ family response regulator